MANPGSTGPLSAGERRATARTIAVWDALDSLLSGPPRDVLDIGGGTGVSAVRIAELGHRVLVIDPNPDALAALGLRAEESGVADRVDSRQGYLSELPGLVGADHGADLVLCHGVLEHVEDPAAALATIADVLRPDGVLSLLVAQRHAAVVTKALAGHFSQARALLDDPDAGAGTHGGRRFTAVEVQELAEASGLRITDVHAVQVFADLVPGSVLDHEPGAAQALVELERAVANQPEYLSLASQVHLLARR